MAAKKKLKEEEKRKLNKENLKKLTKLFSYVGPYKGKFIIGLIFLSLGSVAMMGFPLFAGKIVDVAQGTPFYIFKTVNSIALALVVIIVLQGFIAFFRVYLFSIVSEKSMADLRFDLYKHLILLPMEFYDKNRTGELMSRISSDVSTIQSTFTTTLAELIRQLITLTVGIGIIVVLAPKLTVFMLAIFPLMIAGALVFGKLIRKQTKKTQDELAKTNVIVEETLQAINTVKAFTGELFELGRYKNTLAKTVAIAIKASLYRSGFIAYIIPSLFGVFVAVMWYGALQLQSGELEPGSLLSFLLIMGFVGGSIAGLGSLFTQVQSAIGASERILEIMDEETETGLESNDKVSPLNGHISFQSVTFSYPTREEFTVLKNLNIDIKQGTKVALVGKSGAGKSTIAQLLQSFYKVGSGEVLIDGQTTNQIGLRNLRGNIGIVPQEVILFGGTIKENILYGKVDASDDEIKEAAIKANAWQFIESFPEGFDTVVGERGVKLSGGQKQRIAIARAILKNPSILILDEATSSLDAESEHLVQQALENLMKGRTTLIIAHRLATIRSADKILILENGQIIESGSHEELVNLENGKYNNLIKLQLEGLTN